MPVQGGLGMGAKDSHIWKATLHVTRKPNLMFSKYQARSSGSIRQRVTGLSFRMMIFPTFSCM